MGIFSDGDSFLVSAQFNVIKTIFKNKPALAWAFYDWGNSAFATTVIAVFFPVFYSALSSDIAARDSQFWFNITLAVSGIFIAAAAPVLGAIADRCGKRKKFLATFALLGILMSASLAWVSAGMWWVGLLLYGVGSVGFSGANIFYDSMLVEVAEPEEFDRVSAFGYALGYIGGGLLLLVNVLMVTQPQWFGFADAGAALSAAFISVAIWWGVFTVPLLRGVREHQPLEQVTARRAIADGFAQLAATFKDLRRMRTLFIFLIAYWFYIDGVGAIIRTAVFFADRILNLPRTSLITAILLTQFVAFPAALFFGWLADKIGARRGILIGIGVYIVVILYAWRWLNTAADFYLLATAIGLVQGGVQSLSRSLYARFIPPNRHAEFFGFYNMVGKTAAVFGPLLMAAVPILIPVADERDTILSLLLLFLIGGWLLWKVDVNDIPRT